jgi:uncharacterized membrane protein YbaN (DUF454 family)
MTALLILGFLLLAAGIVSCVLPILPGPWARWRRQ